MVWATRPRGALPRVSLVLFSIDSIEGRKDSRGGKRGEWNTGNAFIFQGRNLCMTPPRWMPHAEMGSVLIVIDLRTWMATNLRNSLLNSTKKIERRTREISSRGDPEETADECVWREVERSFSLSEEENSGEDE